MRNSRYFIILLIFMFLTACFVTDSTPEERVRPDIISPVTEAHIPNAMPPAIMVDDVLYRVSETTRGALKIEVSEDEYLGFTTSVVPASEIPRENGQANAIAVGSPYIKYEDGIAVLWYDNKWHLFEHYEWYS